MRNIEEAPEDSSAVCKREGMNSISPRWLYLLFALLSSAVLLGARYVPLKWLPMTRCGFLRLTGWPCPFCGFLRAFKAGAQGEWAGALHQCPLGALSYGATWLVFILALLGLGLNFHLPRFKRRTLNYVAIVVLIAVMLNWVYRILYGFK